MFVCNFQENLTKIQNPLLIKRLKLVPDWLTVDSERSAVPLLKLWYPDVTAGKDKIAAYLYLGETGTWTAPALPTHLLLT